MYLSISKHKLKTKFLELHKYIDQDGYHPYYIPDLNDPDTWMDYINDPDHIIKEDWFALGQQELDNALQVIRSNGSIYSLPLYCMIQKK